MFLRERPPDYQRLAEPKPNSFSVLVTIDGQLVGDLDIPVLPDQTTHTASPERVFHERQLAAGWPISACRFGQVGMASFLVNSELITVRRMEYHVNMHGGMFPRLTKLEISRHRYYEPFFLDAGGVPAGKGRTSQGNFYSIRGWVKATGKPIELTVVYNF
jgi:hypothetical protein